ncbi:MAG: hypothetical protein KAQ68_03960 [Clostridiales bacterium]|nr:hypothetical protein [Clostridiales bacterium]
MSNIIIRNSYNMDILSFLNVMTSNLIYTSHYKKEYNHFYPLLSSEIKEGFSWLITKSGRVDVASLFTTIISSLDDYNNRDVKKMLSSHEEIDRNMQNSQHYYIFSEAIKQLPHFSGLIIKLVKELEDSGFKEFWETEKLSLINNRCSIIQELVSKYDVIKHVTKYKRLPYTDIIIYVCSFAYPHATKLCENALIVDYYTSDKVTIGNIIHELFHPPYSIEIATKVITDIANKKNVITAYQNQNLALAYKPIEAFVEENIVEALGVHILVNICLENEPYEYFETHDGGSHVLSPPLFKYLQENDINSNEAFEEYLERFVCTLNTVKIMK